MADYKNIKVEESEGIARLTINRPESMNALNMETLTELDQAMEALSASPSLKGIILTGSGEKAFVAGADIAELHSLSPHDAHTLSEKGHMLFRRIETFNKPIIAAVNGFALGGGCELAMACHFRYASTNALFGQPEVKLGLIPGYAGTQRLPKLVGRGRATEMLLTGDMIDANEALRMGLVNKVLAMEELMPQCEKTISKIARMGPLAISSTLACIDSFYNKKADGDTKEQQEFGRMFATDDFKEGTSAFLEKRKAQFKGN